MTRRQKITILTTWTSGFAVLAVLFLVHGSVAPCLGLLPTTNDSCIATWEAQRPWTDRFFDTPFPTMALLGLMILVTAVVVWRARSDPRAGLRDLPRAERAA
jgi:hypothetical protein